MKKRKFSLLLLIVFIVSSLVYVYPETPSGVHYPVINSNETIPSVLFYTGYYGTNFTIQVNVTDPDENTRTVNYTLRAPNGTNVIYNVNATSRYGDFWNTSYYAINQYGIWTYTITATDNDLLSTIYEGTIGIMEITLSSNKTLADIESPVYLEGYIINSSRLGAEYAEYFVFLNDTQVYTHTTDDEGYYNFTITTPEDIGIYNLKINSTHLLEYSENNISLEVQDIPNINEFFTIPNSLYYLGRAPINFTITVNATDDTLYSVNFTVTAPNGTYVIYNQNATSSHEDWYNSSKIMLDQYGQWNFTITALDEDDYNLTVDWFIKVLEISQELNTTIADNTHKAQVYGNIKDWHGDDVVNTTIYFFINDTRYYYNETWDMLVPEPTNNLSKTDFYGFFNYSFNTSLDYGIYEVKVNTSYDGGYGEQISYLRVMPYPTINSYWTVPSPVFYTGEYGSFFYIGMDVTDDDDNLLSVNYTLRAPNGTFVFTNINASSHAGSIWETEPYRIDQYGQWTYTITAWDSLEGSHHIEDEIRFLEITLNMNETITEQNNSIRIYGYAYDYLGGALANLSLYFYLDDILLNISDGWNFNNPVYWWNISWKERLPLVIRLNDSITIEKMLVNINFSTDEFISEGKMKSDCSDIRFADKNGNELEYTIEHSTCDSEKTLFWIWLDIIGNSNKTIYAYYSNPEAEAKLDFINPDDSLKTYLRFDGSEYYGESISNIYDFSRNNNNATGISVTQDADCLFGRCYSFDSDDDMIVVPNTDMLSFGNGTEDYPFTIISWIYMEDSSYFPIVSKAHSIEYAEYALYTNESGYLHFNLYDNYLDSSVYIVSNFTLSSYEGQWIMVTATYNASGQNNGTSLYINSELVNVSKGAWLRPDTEEYVAMHNEDTNLYVGHDANLSVSARGKIDDIRIYNRSLHQNEIEALYNLTKTFVIHADSFTQTDSNGYFNYIFNAPDSYADFEIKVNATYNSIYGMNNLSLRVTPGGNSPPEIIFINITPEIPNTTSSLYCNIIAHDYETENLILEYWWINQTSGSEVFMNGTTDIQSNIPTILPVLNYDITSIGEIWNCTAKVFDGSKYSSNSSYIVSITNVPPLKESFSIMPEIPDTNSEIECYASFIDELNTEISVEWAWYNLTDIGYVEVFSGNKIIENNTLSLITSLWQGDTSTGETWNCTLRAYDGIDYSEFFSEVKMVNIPPILTLSSLYDFYNETSNIGCEAIAIDAENQTMRVEWAWYNLTDTGYVEVLSGNTSIENNTLVNISVLEYEKTSSGETWNCTAILHDGFNHTAYFSSSTRINTLPEIVYKQIIVDEDFNIECSVNLTDPEHSQLNVEWVWYNLTDLGFVEFLNGTAEIETNTLSLITTLDSENTKDDEIWNCTIRAYDGYGYSGYASTSRLVDKLLPTITLNYPTIYSILSNTTIEINYTLNESNINHTWYNYDYKGEKIELTYTVSKGENLQNITFDYPGKHTLEIYVNDTFGNIASDSTTFYIDYLLNITKWAFNFNESQSNVSSIIISNSTHQNILGNTTVQQNLSLEINMSDIKVFIYNLTAWNTRWEYFFEIENNSSYFESVVRDIYGTEAVDYVYTKNFSKFYNDSAYYAKIVLPKDIDYYDSLHYCPDDRLDLCEVLTACVGDYSTEIQEPCYNSTLTNVNVFVPSLGSVFGAIDTVAPTITFLNPMNNSIIENSYHQNVSFIINEEALCSYSFDETIFVNLGSGNTFAIYFNYTENTDKNITVRCRDNNYNFASSKISYTIHDMNSPELSGYDASISSDEIIFSFNTDEPSNVTFMLIGEETKKSSVFLLNHEYTFDTLNSNTLYRYNITLCDRINNCQIISGTEQTYSSTTDSGPGSSGSPGSSDTSGTTGTGVSSGKVFNQMFINLPKDLHHINIVNIDIAITKIIFETINVVNGTITFRIESKNLPAQYPGLIDAYQYVSIDKTVLKDEDISSIIIRFRVDNRWIRDNDINPDTISLYRYTSRWDKLRTEKISADSAYTYYESSSPGFSYFGIKGEKNPERPPIVEKETDDIEVVVDDSKDVVQVGDSKPTIIEKEEPVSFNALLILIILAIIIIVIAAGFFLSSHQKNLSKSINDNNTSTFSDSKDWSSSSSHQNMPSAVGPSDFSHAGSKEDIKELEDYILLCRSQGIEESSIKSVLLNTGWDEKTIDLVMGKTGMPAEELQMIMTYITTLRQNNISDEAIRQKLKEAGWQEFAIEEAFRKMTWPK
jgi:PGF-pre-PGF domain-containing protein